MKNKKGEPVSCQTCNSDRIISISGKHSDAFYAQMNGKELEGYAPNIAGVCSGDYTNFSLCMECGQVQEDWPKENPEFVSTVNCHLSPNENHKWSDDGDCIFCGMVEK